MSEQLSVVRVILGFVIVLAIIFVVPFLVYALFTVVAGLKEPAGASATRFLTSVFVQKIGTALAFVAFFALARGTFGNRWLLYAALWWLMFAFGEIGQAIGPNYSWKEALAGIISESLYFPLGAYTLTRLLGPR